MLNKSQNRREITEPLLKAFNSRFLESLYLNHPDFDFMCIIKAKSDESIVASTNLIYASGSFSSFNCFRAFEAEGMKDIYELASNNMASYISAKQKSQESYIE